MREKKISEYEVKMEFKMGKGHPDPAIQRLNKVLE
jgi:hypothetical protein